ARLKTRRAARPQSAEAALSLRKQADGAPSGLLGAIVKRLPHFESVGNRLERAGSPLNAQQFSFRCLLAMLIIIIGTRTLGKPLLLGVFLGIILAVWLPLKVLSFRIGRKQKAFLQVFPDAIDLIVRGLRSGLPVAESVNLVAQEVPEPVSGAFKHAANTMKLGVSMEKALQEVARKLNYTEFNFFVTSIILQRETGGNLSEILNNLSEVLRKRYMMRMKIKAMTSEARASSMIIGALPFLVGGAVSVMSPDYIKVLFTDYRGNEALAVAAGMMGFGMWVMNRMAKFEI
ncbi:MAG: type II secretion system F family protein, partial [Alphaproteobacteria bacterium]|nr:type II secretion system F family protein [Alphaproteobacteria bacterium]